MASIAPHAPPPGSGSGAAARATASPGSCARSPWPSWSSPWCGSSAVWSIARLAHFHLSLLTTYPVGNAGGLLNSIEGTFVHRGRRP